MSSAIQNLEYLKYFTLKGNTVGFRSKGGFLDWIGNESTMETPEELDLIIRSIRMDYGSFCFPDLPDDVNYMYKFDLRNIAQFEENNGNNYMIPNFTVDSVFNNVSYKSYIFISDYYKTLKETQPDIVEAWKYEYLDSNPSRYKFPHSMVITVKSDKTDVFEAFMNLCYDDWKDVFDLAVANKNSIKLNKYHPKIFSYELTFDQAKFLLENFETLNLSSEIILAILKPKDVVNATLLMNYLRNSTTKLNARIFQYFIEPFDLERFVEYNNTLMELGATAIDRSVIENIAINEANTYIEHPNADWNIFNKLAENAGVFAISTKPVLTSVFGVFSYFPKNLYTQINPFNYECLPASPGIAEVEKNETKIHFGYSAVLKAKPTGSDGDRIVRFPKYDPFQIVKVYMVDEPEELKNVDNYKGFVDALMTGPKYSKVRYTYMPAICAYNLYLLNFRNHNDLVKSVLLKATLTGVSAFITAGYTAAFSIPWFLGTAATVTSLTNLVIDAPGIKQEILAKEGGQEFIDAMHTLEEVVIAIDFAYAGFYGIKNLAYFVTNKNVITAAKETFLLQYWKLSPQLRAALAPFYKSVAKNMDSVLLEAAEFEALISSNFLEGKSLKWIAEQKTLNGVFPLVPEYVKPIKNLEYETLVKSEKISFFITKREIIDSDYIAFQLERYAGIRSHMDIVESNYLISGKRTGQLVDDLAVKQGKFLDGDEIYRVDIDDFDKIGIRMPDGRASGTVDNLWKPCGYLKPFQNLSTGEKVFPRETMYYKVDGTMFIHNRNWDTFVNLFEEVGTVRQINP